MQAKKIVITGKVQGVFFRKSAKEKAEYMGILGTIENAADGSVVIYAAGDDEPMGRFIDWCKEGPKDAVVEHVEVTDAEETKDYRWFEIVGK